MEKLEKYGVEPKRIKKTSELKGESFVITGSLNSMSREEAENEIRKHGGEATSSVSRGTTCLIAGENPGSKLQKAEKLNVNIIEEKEFLRLIKQ